MNQKPQMSTRPVVYAEDVVGHAYRELGWFRRLVLRWVSRDLRDASRHLAKHRSPIVQVPLVPATGPFDGPITRAVEKHFANL